jgi:hypothetical protein
MSRLSPSPVKGEGSKSKALGANRLVARKQNSLPPSRGKGARANRSERIDSSRRNRTPFPPRGGRVGMGVQGLPQGTTPIPSPSPAKGEGSKSKAVGANQVIARKENFLSSGPHCSRGRSAVRGGAAECPASPVKEEGAKRVALNQSAAHAPQPTVDHAEKSAEWADKPGSVRPRNPPARQSFIWAARRRTARATYPEAARATPMLPYLVLLPMGFAVPLRVATSAVRSYRTISPLPAGCPASAVCFLLHFPSARAAQALPGTVP